MTWGYIAVAVVATAATINESRKARKAQARAAKVAERRREVEVRRAKLASVEEGRLAIGQLQNVAAQTGGAGGSGVAGNVASLQTQVASNLNFNEQLLTFAKTQERYMQQSYDATARAGNYSAIANLALTFAGSGLGGGGTPSGGTTGGKGLK